MSQSWSEYVLGGNEIIVRHNPLSPFYCEANNINAYSSIGLDELPAIYELTCWFSMLLPFPRVMRNPTIKDEIRDKDLGENYSFKQTPRYTDGVTLIYWNSTNLVNFTGVVL